MPDSCMTQTMEGLGWMETLVAPTGLKGGKYRPRISPHKVTVDGEPILYEPADTLLVEFLTVGL